MNSEARKKGDRKRLTKRKERREKERRDSMNGNMSYKVHELFASDFRHMLERDVRAGKYVSYELNLQGCEYQKHLNCGSCLGSELLYFSDAVDMEIKENNIAIVFMTAFGVADANDVIYVVVSD